MRHQTMLYYVELCYTVLYYIILYGIGTAPTRTDTSGKASTPGLPTEKEATIARFSSVSSIVILSSDSGFRV